MKHFSCDLMIKFQLTEKHNFTSNVSSDEKLDISVLFGKLNLY